MNTLIIIIAILFLLSLWIDENDKSAELAFSLKIDSLNYRLKLGVIDGKVDTNSPEYKYWLSIFGIFSKRSYHSLHDISNFFEKKDLVNKKAKTYLDEIVNDFYSSLSSHIKSRNRLRWLFFVTKNFNF
jgi:hypothetical protein